MYVSIFPQPSIHSLFYVTFLEISSKIKCVKSENIILTMCFITSIVLSPEADSSILVGVKGSEDVLGKSFCISAGGGGVTALGLSKSSSF